MEAWKDRGAKAPTKENAMFQKKKEKKKKKEKEEKEKEEEG